MVDSPGPDPMEALFQDAFGPSLAAKGGDGALLEGLVERAVSQAPVGAGPGGGAGSASQAVAGTAAAGTSLPAWVVLVGLAGVVLVGAVFARGVLHERDRTRVREPQAQGFGQVGTGAPADESTLSPAQLPPPGGGAETGRPAETKGSGVHAGLVPSPLSHRPAVVTPGRSGGSPASRVGAAAMLTQANELRREGSFERADRRFDALAHAHLGTREEVLARVTHGRLLLEHLDRAEDALAKFDAYLEAKPKGTLAEEALRGRARAFAALGKPAKERAAWQRLLASFPESVHATGAKARILELE